MEVVIGYDINEYYAQISYAPEGGEPETLQFPSRNEGGNIETALCKSPGVNQWFCGKEAVKKGVSGEGILLEHLWRLLAKQETVFIEKKEYRVSMLCNLFLGRTLDWALQRLEEIYEEPVRIKAMVLTAEPWDDKFRDMSESLFGGLPVEKENIFMQGHEESLFYYLIKQPERLLGYETGVFDLTGEKMISYRVEMNHKTRPIVTTMEKELVEELEKKKHYASIMEHDRRLEELDLKLRDYAESFTRGRIVMALYLIGEGFGGDWYKESLKVLCRNRKVFAGNNLFGKGACYTACERMWPSETAEKFLFLGKDMLCYNVGIRMQCDEKEEYIPLLDAGTSWYEAKAETVFMMEKADTVELLITPLDGSGTYTETIALPPMPKRPFRAFRFSLLAEMQSKTQMLVRIRDEGFGDLYERLPVDVTYELVLGDGGENE